MSIKIYNALLIFLFFLSFAVDSQNIDSLNKQIDSKILLEKQIELKLKLADDLSNSDIKQALLKAKEALFDAETISSERLVAESKLQIGKCYDYLGINVEALEYLKDALSIFNRLNNQLKRTYTVRQIGNIYYYSNEFNLALKYYKEVYCFGKSVKDTSLMIQGIIGRGSVYGNTNKLDSAMILFKESYSLSKACGDISTEVQSLFFMGDVYLYSNRPRMALNVYKEVEKNYDLQVVNSKFIPSLYNSITYAHLCLNNLDSAKLYNKKEAEILKKFPRIIYKMDYYKYKFQIDTLEKNYKSAIRSLLSYESISDSINSTKFKERLANFETVYQLEKKEREIDRLTLDNRLKDMSIKQKRIINYGSVFLVLLMFAIVFQVFRSVNRTKEKNKILQTQREELAASNEELYAINDELYTQRGKLEATLDDLHKAQEQLIVSEKMASLGVMAAGIAHEINNPLNFIQGGITGIDHYLTENLPDHRKNVDFYINGINEGVQRSVKIVQGLSHYSRNSNLVTEKVDLHNIVDNCLLMLQNKTKNRIEIIKNFTAAPYIIVGNEGKLHQAIMNILANAVQSIDNKGSIHIDTCIENNSFLLMIADNGCGISDDNLSKIFDPFFTTKQPGEGTGLGMSITYNIIKEHNGLIEIKSKTGSGTTVILKLPII